MDCAFVGPLFTPLVTLVLNVIHEQYKLRLDIEDDIDFIWKELRAIAQAIEDNSSRPGWMLEEWRELAYEMEVCLGLFIHDHALERQRSPLGLEDRDGSLMDPSSFARSLKKLREKLEEPKKRLERYRSVSPSSTSTATREPDEPSIRPVDDTIGMSAPLNDLLELILPSPDPTQEKLRVLSIVGPGGIGKTLLARNAYNSVLQVSRFDPSAWVRAGDMTDEDILRELLRGVGVRDETATFNKSKLRELLESHLKGKRYLIVIDDMRTEQQWKDIKYAFPSEPQVSSRVIVTTTSQPIAGTCSFPNGYVYRMRSLDQKNSTRLFSTEAALDEHPDAVAQGSAELVRKCDGLPLALVSIAKFVKEKGGLDCCGYICSRLGFFLEEERTLERMQWVLARKYTSLDPALKSRLLYFCTFNCSDPIKRDSIIRRWIAEGFIEQKPRRRSSPMTEQKKSWETLIDQNIIGATDMRINGEVKRCRPPGMVLEYISNKSMVEKFVAFPDQTPLPHYIRRISMHHGRGDLRNFGNSYPRTLAVSGQAGKDVLDFTNCQLMRVLDLEHCTDLENRHLEKICDLFLLKYLSLGASITDIPTKIKNLEWLETLDLRKTMIKAVPKEVILLPELKHLLGQFQLFKGDYSCSKTKLEKFLSEEGKLETLTGFVVGRNQGFPQLLHIMTTRRLSKLKIWCNSEANGTNLSDLSKAITKFCSEGTNKPDLDDRSLSIDFQDCPDSSSFQQFMSSLSKAGGSLASLKLRGPGAQLSKLFTICMNLRGLTELCLWSTTTLRWHDIVIVGLGNFHVLRYMKLVAVEIIGSVVIDRQQLEGLKRMCFVVEERLPEITIKDGALRYLVSLHLICKHLDGLSGIEIGHLKGLKEVALHCGSDEDTVKAWKAAARRHPNRPDVLSIEDPHHAKKKRRNSTTKRKHPVQSQMLME